MASPAVGVDRCGTMTVTPGALLGDGSRSYGGGIAHQSSNNEFFGYETTDLAMPPW